MPSRTRSALERSRWVTCAWLVLGADWAGVSKLAGVGWVWLEAAPKAMPGTELLGGETGRLEPEIPTEILPKSCGWGLAPKGSLVLVMKSPTAYPGLTRFEPPAVPMHAERNQPMLTRLSSIVRPALMPAPDCASARTDTPVARAALPEFDTPSPAASLQRGRRTTAAQLRLQDLWRNKDTTLGAVHAAHEHGLGTGCVSATQTVLDLRGSGFKERLDIPNDAALQVLNLKGCTDLPGFPMSVFNARDLRELDLSDVPLTHLPVEILSELPAGCVVTLSAKGLDPELVKLLERISLGQPAGAQFKFNDRPCVHVNAPLIDQVHAWQQSAGGSASALSRDSLQCTWAPLSQTPEGQKMATFLWRLRETKDFKNPSFADGFQRRVGKLLERMGQCDALRERCFAKANQALGQACDGDTLAYALVQMEKDSLHQEAFDWVKKNPGKVPLQTLIERGLGLYRFEKLEAIAQQKSSSESRSYLPHHTLLAYLAHFSNLPAPTQAPLSTPKALTLPIESHDLCNPFMADLRPQDFAAARLVLQAPPHLEGGLEFNRYLNQWPPMQAWREQQAALR